MGCYGFECKSISFRYDPIGLLDMGALYYRPDAHPGEDCLHFCLPGPIDIVEESCCKCWKMVKSSTLRSESKEYSHRYVCINEL